MNRKTSIVAVQINFVSKLLDSVIFGMPDMAKFKLFGLYVPSAQKGEQTSAKKILVPISCSCEEIPDLHLTSIIMFLTEFL
ncbi:hypothetical protein BpHYR1_021082 [Brachionus plicatilis]|uniref:Uncharacterized protein n=1 Tax=Brachionus plicatilis TaxID=10195 RepID=A0A3M7P6Y6_BRAPC|nr:hypothetical protein BpHYR1_021082 [Brachionus plicatilis]